VTQPVAVQAADAGSAQGGGPGPAASAPAPLEVRSLGTLVAAQATSSVRGANGAGQFHPSLADLVVHGCVVALERVQQLLWTLTAIGMFVWIVVKNYAESTEIPRVPDELLILMGISAGAATWRAHKPGPVVARVRGLQGSIVLAIEGQHLSPRAEVYADGRRIDAKPTVAASDPGAPDELATDPRFLGRQRAEAGAVVRRSILSSSRIPTASARNGGRRPPSRRSPSPARPGAGKLLTVETEYVGAETKWENRADLAPGSGVQSLPCTRSGGRELAVQFRAHANIEATGVGLLRLPVALTDAGGET